MISFDEVIRTALAAVDGAAQGVVAVGDNRISTEHFMLIRLTPRGARC